MKNVIERDGSVNCLNSIVCKLLSFPRCAYQFYDFTQIYAMPVFDMIETLFVKKLNFKPSWALRLVTRITYVG